MSESHFVNSDYQRQSDRLRAELAAYGEVRFLDLPTSLQSKVHDLAKAANRAEASELYPKGLEVAVSQLSNATSKNSPAVVVSATITGCYFLIDWVEAEQKELRSPASELEVDQ